MNLSSRLRHLLDEGQSIVGTFVKLPSTEVVDIAAGVGLDFAIADLEHSQLSEANAGKLVRHAHALSFPMLVRLPTVDRGAVNRLLEAGAAGIQLSTLRSVRQREELVDASRYPPIGHRSISLGHPRAGYGAVSMSDYLEDEAEGPLLVGQIETEDTDDPLEGIVEGLDVVFLGATDLALDMGHPGEPSHERVVGRAGAIAKAALSAGVAFGGWAGSADALPLLGELGARYIAVGSDVSMLRAELAGTLAEIRAALTGDH